LKDRRDIGGSGNNENRVDICGSDAGWRGREESNFLANSQPYLKLIKGLRGFMMEKPEVKSLVIGVPDPKCFDLGPDPDLQLIVVSY
jgi:hypothetical protein